MAFSSCKTNEGVQNSSLEDWVITRIRFGKTIINWNIWKYKDNKQKNAHIVLLCQVCKTKNRDRLCSNDYMLNTNTSLTVPTKYLTLSLSVRSTD